MDDTDAAIAAEQQQVKNPFPTPPPYWTRYTPENLRLLGLLQTRLKENKEIRIIEEEESSITEGDEDVDQAAILADEESLPPFSLLELEPPRLDWILEQETYSSFGEIYLTKEEEQIFPPGVKRLYEGDANSDLRPFMRQLLLSLLAAYHKLLSDILEPVPSGYHRPPESSDINGHSSGQDATNEDGTPLEWPPPLNWEATVLWIRTLGMNMGWAINEYRPIQARIRLESMIQRQIEVRKEETRAVHAKCEELEKMLADLRNQTKSLLPKEEKGAPTTNESDTTTVIPTGEGDAIAEENTVDLKSAERPQLPELSMDDLLEWTREVKL